MANFFSYLKKNKIPKKDFLTSLNQYRDTQCGFFIFLIRNIVLLLIFILIIKINNKTIITIPQNGGSLSEGIIGSPNIKDSSFINKDINKSLSGLIYSSLLKKDINNNIVPDIAESYQVSPDQKSYTFNIKNNARFSNKKPVEAKDILFTFNKIKESETDSINKDFLNSIDVKMLNEKSIVFILKEEDKDFLKKMTFNIMSEENMTSLENETILIGSGPFRVGFIKEKDGIIKQINLIKNKHYYSSKPFLNEINLKFFANEDALSEALLNNDIDFSFYFSTDSIEKNNSKKLFTKKVLLDNKISLFQTKNDITISDPILIDTINLYLDRTKIIDKLSSGYGLFEESNLIPITKSESNEKLKKIGYVIKNGFLEKNGSPILYSIAVENSDYFLSLANYLSNELNYLGITVNVKAYDYGKYQEGLVSGDYKIVITDDNNLKNSNIYKKILTLYTKSIFYIANKKTNLSIPYKIESLNDRYNDVNRWYTKTQKVWKVFNNNN